ncbi:MAG: V-type ATPase subunit [Candidatus Omnitrophica bacterium]|nr:V-type ATPase subunit [Candidatus Omnitrophota bacterium]
MAGINRLGYAFAVGKIRVMETRLLTKKDFLKILDLDLKGALKYIVENSDYSAELLEIKDSTDLDLILDSKLSQVYLLIQELLREKDLIQDLVLNNLSQLLKKAEAFNLDFLIDYLKSLFDLLNIKIFFRFKNLKKQKEELVNLLFSLGYIKKDFFLDMYLKPWEVFLESFRSSAYARLVKEAYDYFNKEGSFLKLEMLMDEFLIEKIKKAKYICLGPEPLLGYYLAKRNEINLLRWVIFAKLNNLPKEKVVIRLNQTYV